MDTHKLNLVITKFMKNKEENSTYYEENWAECKECKEYYRSFTKDKLISMTEEEFLSIILL